MWKFNWDLDGKKHMNAEIQVLKNIILNGTVVISKEPSFKK